MEAAFRGNTTKAEARERSRKENQDELGVCRIRRQTAEDRHPQTLGSGFVVKDLQIFPGVSFSYCLISSDKVFPKDDCNIECYFLDFKKLKSTDLKTVELEHVAVKPSNFTRTSGLVLIPINPSKKYNKDQSIFTYRPFKVANERIPPDEDLKCYFVEEDSGRNFSLTSLALKRSETVSMQYQLHEVNEPPHTKYDGILSRGGHRKPYGAVILMRSNEEFVAVGALTFADNEERNICCPLFPLPLHTNPRAGITHNEQTHNQVPNFLEPANTDGGVPTNANSEASGDGSTHSEQPHTQVLNMPEPANTDGGVPTDANSEASGDGITHSEQPHTQVLNVPGSVNTVEVVNPNPSHEAFRDYRNQERNAATAGATEAPKLNQEATVPVPAAGAAAAETVPQHPDGTNLGCLTSTPIQEESVDIVDEGATSDETAPSKKANKHDQLYVSDVIIKDKSLQDKLARKLDHTPHRVIKTWEHLACTKEVNVPLEIRCRIKLNSENSCTMTLIDFLSVEMGDKTVHDLIEALKAINRHDVVGIITAVYSENSTEKIGDFASSNANSEMIKRIATKLDKKSLVNDYWIHLGQQFEICRKKLKEIEYGPSNPALVLMKYLYSKQEDLTVGRFYEEVDKLKRGDVLKELEPFLKDRSQKLMKDVIEPESAVMRSICVYLNDPRPALNNWRYLASAFKVPSEIYEDFNPEGLMSPTNSLFEWISANRRDLTVRQLCAALKSIERNDVVRDLRKHLEQQSTEQE